MDAENLNVGGTTGLDLRAELPQLNGRADIAIRGEGDEKTVAIKIQQTSRKKSRLISTANNSTEAVRAELKLRKKENRELEILATGQVNQFALYNEKWSGRFNVNAKLDEAFKELSFSGNVVAPDLPPKIGAIPLILHKGPVTSSVEGYYSISEKQLVFKSLR